MTTTYTCPSCGYQELERPPFATWPPPAGVLLAIPYYEQLGWPSYETCPLCGFEFGATDDPGTATGETFEEYAAAWVDGGRQPYDGGYELPERHRPDHARNFRGFVWDDDGLAVPVSVVAGDATAAAAIVDDEYGAGRAITLWNELEGDAEDRS